MDEMNSITRGLTTENLAEVRGKAQVAVLRKSLDEQAQQAQQLIDAVPRAVQPGQPGGIINTKA